MLEAHARLLAELDRRRQTFLTELEALDAAALTFRPAPDAWSLLDIAEHLALVERGTLAILTDPRHAGREFRRRPKNLLGYAALFVVLKTSIRVPMPGQVRELVAPSGAVDLPTLRTRWTDTGAELRRHFTGYTEADRNRLVGLHPVGGPLTPRRVLLFLIRHFDHHMRQARRRKRELGAR